MAALTVGVWALSARVTVRALGSPVEPVMAFAEDSAYSLINHGGSMCIKIVGVVVRGQGSILASFTIVKHAFAAGLSTEQDRVLVSVLPLRSDVNSVGITWSLLETSVPETATALSCLGHCFWRRSGGSQHMCWRLLPFWDSLIRGRAWWGWWRKNVEFKIRLRRLDFGAACRGACRTVRCHVRGVRRGRAVLR